MAPDTVAAQPSPLEPTRPGGFGLLLTKRTAASLPVAAGAMTEEVAR